MVQRKVEQDKLGIQANLLKHDQNSLKKPPSFHHQDGKTIRGPEVKKKAMKKSRSFKLSDISQKTLKSSSLSSSSSSSSLKPQPSQHVPKSLETSPNYMKPTTCSDAKKELQSKASNLARNLTKTPGFKLSVIGSANKCSKSGLCASPGHVDVQRPTCSSTLKDSKFPSYLTLAHGGTGSEGNSVVKVCPYTYCSLNGHLHKSASLPPLKCFLSAKRSALKPRRSSELAEDRAGIELFIRNCAEKEARDFEIRAEEPLERASEEIGAIEASDMEVEEDEAADISSEMDEDSESESVSGSSSEIEDEVIQELFSTDDDEFEDLSGGGETEAKEVGGAFEAEEDETMRNGENDQVCDPSQKTNDDVDDQVSSEESKDTPSRNQAGNVNISISDEEEEEESKTRERSKREAKESSSGGDEEREFNPREPNYLPLAVDPDGEKVELKHQDMDERKNSEEWMIDRALQQTVTKLGPARKRRVALLVEAFETVAPVTKREAFHRLTNHHHHPTSPVFQNPIWPIQACN